MADAIKQVFDELNVMNKDEFWKEVRSYSDTDRALAIEYALKDHTSPVFKVVDEIKNLIYYYPNLEIFNMALSSQYEIDKLLLAEFALDTKNNQLIKCRYSVEDLVDQFYLNK